MARSEAEVKQALLKSSTTTKISKCHVAMILVTNFFAACAFAFFYSVFMGKGLSGFLVGFVVAFASFFPLYYYRFSDKFRCKKCGTQWALDESHTQMIDSHTKSIREKSADGAFDRSRIVLYRETHYWQYCTCKHCDDITREYKSLTETI